MLLFFGLLFQTHANPTWERGEPVPEGGRSNPFHWSEPDWSQAIARGKHHILVYPVNVTGALIPYTPVERFLADLSPNPLRALLQSLSRNFSQIESFADAMRWLGLHPYPPDAGTEQSSIPLPPGMAVGEAMGLSRIPYAGALGFSISCAACHVGQLFGRPILGLTNRFPRANAFFILGKQVTAAVPSPAFAWLTQATSKERLLYRRTRYNMWFVGSKRPEVLGLDTSLAHVALSLARRAQTPDADKIWENALRPRAERLATFPADSKPAVWWNLKFKNRWLADGSVVSGNPIVTNILWNEIGRGTNLTELKPWLTENENTLRDLVTAVFASEAPPITDFFPRTQMNIEGARRGERHYLQHCSRCHGVYRKEWERDFRTTKVIYHAQTPVIDVGTDPHRYQGMESLAQLNRLSISEKFQVQIEPQKGYVPPPLVGIWARWPYFHNNSSPSLCAVLTRGSERPHSYWAGEPIHRERDFDFACNGYPTGAQVPAEWRTSAEHFFDSERIGLSRLGHDEGIFLKNGHELLNPQEKLDLIRFLQTL